MPVPRDSEQTRFRPPQTLGEISTERP